MNTQESTQREKKTEILNIRVVWESCGSGDYRGLVSEPGGLVRVYRGLGLGLKGCLQELGELMAR
jgi:hypothetical protein